MRDALNFGIMVACLFTVFETSRPRWGRMFAPTHELALADAALEVCKGLPAVGREIVVVKELAGPLGVPDYTALVVDGGALGRRFRVGIPPLLNKIDAAIVAVSSPTASRSVAAIAKSLGWSADTVLRRIVRLLRVGAMHESSGGRFVRAPELGALGRIYAIETKVDNCTAAINEARLYGVWADSYVLVMGGLGVRALTSVSEKVAADNAGLFVDGKWISRRFNASGSDRYGRQVFVADSRGVATSFGTRSGGGVNKRLYHC